MGLQIGVTQRYQTARSRQETARSPATRTCRTHALQHTQYRSHPVSVTRVHRSKPSASIGHILSMRTSTRLNNSHIPVVVKMMRQARGAAKPAHLRLQSVLSQLSASRTAATQAAPSDYQPYTLTHRTQISPDSCQLRFRLPEGMHTLDASLPSCLKVKKAYPVSNSAPVILDKSYSPVSLPTADGYVEFIVKGYPARPTNNGGVYKGSSPPPGEVGLGAFLCNLSLGETADMAVKADRKIHGATYYPNRWAELGLIAAGTGIAPMLQIVRTVLADPTEQTRLSLVVANRHEDDILMRQEMDALAVAHPSQFRVHYVLSSPRSPSAWTGSTGWVSEDDLSLQLPRPSESTMIMVCGQDEFLVSVCGMTTRGPVPPGKKKGPKIQGSLTGILQALGYDSKSVYKF